MPESPVLRAPLRSEPVPPGVACLRSVGALMLREMATRYVRTPGGFLWAVLEPVAAVLVLTFALSLVVQAPPLGTSFVVFYASGYLPFLLYATLQGHVQQALRFSRPLLVYPSVAWIDAIVARFALNLVSGLAVSGIVLAGLALATGEVDVVRSGALVLALGLAALLGLGLGVLNCLLCGLFPVWAQVWAILSRPLFLVAGVIFVPEDLPERLADVLWFTPWIHLAGLFRSGLYPGYDAAHVSLPLVLGWALVPLALGLALLRRHAEEILNTG
ncbi:ABC transporter permease [Roseicyclus sp.]|uniref:ABC transporter permease n=1 Tax=Roseicyclus sp. TaxID=1914329 RepID=UPI003FA0B284